MKNSLALMNTVLKSLKNLEEQEQEVISWTKNKIPLCHRLAYYLEANANEGKCDLSPVFNNKVTADIQLYDKNNKPILLIFFKKRYFNLKEQKQLIALSKRNTTMLILGITAYPKRNYFLLYRATKDKLEYYHFLRDKKEIVKLMDKNLKKEDPTPSLQFSKGRKRKNK